MKTFTKYIMLSSAVLLLLTGIGLLFASEELISLLDKKEKMTAVAFQLYGGASCAFGILNWMAQNNLIGGIYSRPLIVSNLVFFSTSLTTLISNLHLFLSLLIYPIIAVLAVYSIIFVVLLSKHPIK